MPLRKIVVVSTTRADYGHLRSLAKAIHTDPSLELRLLVAGTHLSEEFGATEREIVEEGIPIWSRIPNLVGSGEELGALRSLASAIEGAGPRFQEDRPDLVVVLGDRTEMIGFALAALILRIPLAHIHGGEITTGALDDSVRHAITKLSTYHFPATFENARVIEQLGETRDRIFALGAPGLDRLSEIVELSREEVLTFCGLDPDRPTALVALHPVTTEGKESAIALARAVVSAMRENGLQAVLTGANADAHGSRISEIFIETARASPERFFFKESLGGRLFINAMRRLDVMVGNSSSGLIEAPSCGIPVVNIGDRQAGRVTAENVISTKPDPASISRGLREALTPAFRERSRRVTNPYAPSGEGKIGDRIKEILKSVPLEPSVLKKSFVRRDWG